MSHIFTFYIYRLCGRISWFCWTLTTYRCRWILDKIIPPPIWILWIPALFSYLSRGCVQMIMTPMINSIENRFRFGYGSSIYTQSFLLRLRSEEKRCKRLLFDCKHQKRTTNVSRCHHQKNSKNDLRAGKEVAKGKSIYRETEVVAECGMVLHC